MKRRSGGLRAAPALALIWIFLLPAPATAASEPGLVTRWIEVGLERIADEKINPPQASRELALLSVSIKRALIGGRKQGFPLQPLADAAAKTVLDALGQNGFSRPESSREPVRYAVARAEEVIAAHANDVRNARVTLPDAYPTGVDHTHLWTPTAPGFLDALEPTAGTWETWAIGDADDFVPGPPPSADPGDPSYPKLARQAMRVHNVSLSLNADQKLIADSWVGGPGTFTPPGLWNEIAIRALNGEEFLFVPTAGLYPTTDPEACDCLERGAIHAARLFATLNSAGADAFIVTWRTKYRYWLQRPITWIREHLDPGWLPYIATPPFPSYISGHSTVSGAASRVLAGYFPGRAREITALGEEATISRLYGGIHFAVDNNVGLRTGRKVGAAALGRYLRP